MNKCIWNCAGSQKLVGWRECSSRLRSRCRAVHFSDLVVTFHGMRKGNVVLWWSKVDFCGRCRKSERLLFDVLNFVAVAALWPFSWARFDFVAGAVNRDLGRCGSFSEIRGCVFAS